MLAKQQALPTPRAGTSPFLPGTNIQYAWDSTSLGYLKKCPRLYQYSIIEGWRPKTTGIDLQFGLWYHKGLELYDRYKAAGIKHEPALEETVLWLHNETYGWEGNNYKNTISLLRSVTQYLDQFGENDPAKTVVRPNGEPAVEISFRFELNLGPTPSYEAQMQGEGHLVSGQPYLLCGHLDRVVEFGGGNYVMDRKTTKSTLSDSYFDQFAPNTQMTLYTLAAKVVLDTPIKGVIIDAMQILIKEPYTRFARGFTYRTPAQLEEWLDDLNSTLHQAEGYARQGYWPMNDSACFLCRFKSICSKDPAVRPAFLEADFTKEDPWNPLRVR